MTNRASLTRTKRRVQVFLWRFRFFILAVSIAVAAGILTDAVRPDPPSQTQVVQLAEDVPAGTVLESGHVVTAAVSGELPADVFLLSDDVVGRRTVIDLRAHTSLSEPLLVPEGSQFALGGLHAVPVPLANSELVDVYPVGTRVRVVIGHDSVSFGTGDGLAEPVVIDDAIVLPPAQTAADEAGGSNALGLPTGGKGGAPRNYLLVGVSPADAIQISSIVSTTPISVIIVE